MNKQELRDLAAQVGQKTGKKVDYVCTENNMYCFQVERRKSYRTIDVDGDVTESQIHDNLLAPNSIPVYFEIKVLTEDLGIDNMVYMVKHNLTRS